MAEIKASDVAKLRALTGAGMMDCKNALQEADGDINNAIDILRKKGQKVANKRADREASEGAVIAKQNANGKSAALIALNCETDFVAKNDEFVKFAVAIAETAVANNAANLDALKAMKVGDHTIADEVMNRTGIIGEKVELNYFEKVDGEQVAVYIHPGNKLASIVAFNKAIDANSAKDIAMQIAAMNPVSIDKSDVPQSVIDKEIEIGKELAMNEGKTAEMAEKISLGKLNKFFQESTLLNQQFIKDNKSTVEQFLQSIDKELKVVAFKRFSLAI